MRPTRGGDLIGHFDWRVQNLAFRDGEIVAIYDRDSLAKAPEPVIVGNTAGGFCIDWDGGGRGPAADGRGDARLRRRLRVGPRASRSTAEEREALDAANLAMVAYGARCQHSDLYLQPECGDTSAIGWLRLLRDRGDRVLLT